ncbi:MAG: 3-hydroxyacyl-ACP dehydratase [Verrucomicrobia bacterium]|jgi:3-hydroxymyristoyl/3-hydroxydecanoyl-(acyl carrier protein) dehydratase|nr:3-hydroxyacyl-ACP dehydratase [Verrucomicrobiota bacterium]
MTELKIKPSVCSEERIECGIVLKLWIDEYIVFFKGHFSNFQILPGVTQIDWAYHYGTTLLEAPLVFKGMEVIKFFKPITPGMEVELTLKWRAEKQKLEFFFQSLKGKHSSGRILLAEDA